MTGIFKCYITQPTAAILLVVSSNSDRTKLRATVSVFVLSVLDFILKKILFQVVRGGRTGT